MKKLFFAALLASLILDATPANATRYKFSIGGGYSGSGVITAQDSPELDGSYLVTDISGSFNGFTISSLIAPNGYSGNDNRLHLGDVPHFSLTGLSFAADENRNLFYIPNEPNYMPGEIYSTDTVGRYGVDGDYSGANVTFSLNSASTSAVPEPTSWALMLLGFGMIGGCLRGGVNRRRDLGHRRLAAS